MATTRDWSRNVDVSVAVLKLVENGKLDQLKRKWWAGKGNVHIILGFLVKLIPGNCANGKSDSNGPSLDMDSFGGIYLILCGGVGLALGVALCEFCGKSDDLVQTKKPKLQQAHTVEIPEVHRSFG